MLCKVLSQFLQYVLPLPCNDYINVTPERCQSKGITVSHNYGAYAIVFV